MTPDNWPDGAPAAVALSFDVDTETIGPVKSADRTYAKP